VKRFKAWRYECEFCGKRNSSGSAMAKHEKHCTMNPNRKCRMCEHGAGGVADLVELMKLVPTEKAPSLDPLRDASEHCPACMYAALKQSKTPVGTQFGPDGLERGADFDFHQECVDFWDGVNTERTERDERGYYY